MLTPVLSQTQILLRRSRSVFLRSVPCTRSWVTRRAHSQAADKQKLYRVARAFQGSESRGPTSPTLFSKEFSLADRIALVTGGRRGIGLEAALALAEAGARRVYCLDLAKEPGEDWDKVSALAGRMGLGGKLEYILGDVRDQEDMWEIGEEIGKREGRLDVCVAAAGVLGQDTPSLEYTKRTFQDIVDVNLNGVLFTAQAAGRQMARFDKGGSIIMVSSVCGSLAVEPTFHSVAYHATKSGVLQLARSMACELGPKNIRVNSLSPGFVRTPMTGPYYDEHPDKEAVFANASPLGRIARPHELRGVFAWLASDASSFCTGTDIFVSGGFQAW